MSKPYACCKDCKDRKVTEDFNCHTGCERYAKMKDEYREQREGWKEFNAARNYAGEQTLAVRKRAGKNKWNAWRWNGGSGK